jgi:hypothetical protein
MKNDLIILIVIITALAATFLGDENADAAGGRTASGKDAIDVLFIGNSLTYYNDMPKMVVAIAESKGKQLRVESLVKGGARLSTHAANQSTFDRISQIDWDFVVLQEQGQLPSWSTRQKSKVLYPFAKKLADAIKKNKSSVVFYMTMARKNGDPRNGMNSYGRMQDLINNGYYSLAQANRALIAPVGTTWQWVRNKISTTELYAHNDPIHPNKLGSYLAACTFYSTLLNDKCEGADIPNDLDPVAAKYIQQVSDAVTADRKKWDLRGK